jgi:membrane-anchored mycosin MYCP
MPKRRKSRAAGGLGAAVVSAVLAGLLLFPATPAYAYRCPQPPGAVAVSATVPWEGLLLDPARLAPLATGAGVRVAVLDSGVDAGHPQLRGRVAPGRDFLHEHPDARQDCVGHGTAVAAVIAARQLDGTGPRGLAPQVTVVPVRVSEQTDESGAPAGPGRFAEAIDWAVTTGAADVLSMSLVSERDDERVRRAVARAIAAGVVVVAAAGNRGDGGPTPYPAAYPDVIGVGAIGPEGVRGAFSQHGDYVDVTAPGVDVTVAARGSGHRSGTGTSYATPFVAATAALVRQRFPDLTPALVTRRILATADPAPGGPHSDEYGYGVVNPYRALTETLGPDTRAVPPPPAPHAADPVLVARQSRRAHAQSLSLTIAATAAAMLMLVAFGAAALRHRRRRKNTGP